MSQAETFTEFWSFYVLAHQQLATRIFHTIGTLSGWSLLAAAIILRRPWLVLAAIVVPYAFAWFSHFFVEHNRPATWASVVVLAGRSENGGDGASGENGRRSETMHGKSE